MMADLRELLKRESQLNKSLAGVERFAENYAAETDKKQVSVRLSALEAIHKEFFAVRSKIELQLEEVTETKQANASPEAKQEAEERLEAEFSNITEVFEDRYYALKAELLELQPQNVATQSASAGTQPASQAGAMMPKVKLPDIRLPSFSGNIREWVTFRDTFRSLIHNNAHLTDMDRFTYLRSALSGEAQREIDSIELCADNYSVAWETLKARYENRKLIVKAHLDALFSAEVLRRESYDGLNRLVSEYEKNLQMLEKIGEKTSEWSTILAHMVCSRLDSTTLRLWETQHNCKEVPTYKELVTFLRNHYSVLQSVAPVKAVSTDYRQQKSAVCHTVATVRTSSRCLFCGELWHTPFQCTRFQRMTIQERNEAVNRCKLCRNCLRPGHYSRFCDKGFCRHCQQKHHSMLHAGQIRSSVPFSQSRPQTQRQEQQRQPQPNQHRPSQPTQTNQTQTANSQGSHTKSITEHATTSHTCIALPITPTQNILLSTALVRVTDRFGNSLLARALLDSCSQHCLMSQKFSRMLKFRESPTYLAIQGIGPSQTVSTKLVNAVEGSRSDHISNFAEEMSFHVLPKLTVALPTASVNPEEWKLPESAILADPRFFETGPVDVIIGAEFFMDLLREENQKATEEGPTLQNTVFGWVVSGRVPNSTAKEPLSLACVSSTADIQDQLAKFWELETCRTSSTNSVEETACEEYFAKTTERDERGRFVVALPKKEFVINHLGDSKAAALRRFAGLERRFFRNPELKEVYAEFIREYQTMGHMKEVFGESTGIRTYYLPHHAVLKPDSTTTKLRVVFDASCQTTSGVSLNDALMVGPVVQDDLLDIVLRFRLHRYALVADIAKMYRMVRMQEADQPLQRIVWRETPDDVIRTFELTTVTYGTASAPYLATKCLQRLAQEGEQTYPAASKVLAEDFYVDDMLTGVDTIDEGRRLIKETVILLQSAEFPLRKWSSNSEELLQAVPEHLRDDRALLELDSSSATVKTLGLIWEPKTDSFRFNTPSWNTSAVMTKRIVLSDVSRLFDPLGLVGPVVVQAKMFIQQLWKQECGWDDPLCADLQEQWLEYRRNLAGLESLSIPRWVGVGSNIVAVELHGFCDASEKAYGACLYVRTISETGAISVQLLTAKSRVAPLENVKRSKNKQSIPRLELSSALLLAHLYERVVKGTRIQVTRAHFYTDSTITKCWLSSSPSRWKEFVGNRSSEIQHITKDGVWHHVAGVENPADIISRGMIPAQLQYQTLWFNGPHWLLLEESNWPTTSEIREEDIDHSVLEEKSVTAVLPAIVPSELFGLRSSLTDLKRITALIQCFRFNAQAANRINRRSGLLTIQEMDDGLKTLVRLSQQESFTQEFTDLSSGRQVRDSSRIARLHPQLMDGIICVGGRLQNADISESRKHPWILDHRHPLARKVVVHYHEEFYHAGQQLLTAAVRSRFWPTNVRDLTRSVIHKCVQCFRVKPTVQEQLMADLPPERVTPCAPFRRVGVDYCGPFYITYPLRGYRPVKCFVAIFVCLVTKAVHLELVADLSTPAFIAALKRFTSRRGKPELIMCDNGTNFVGAKRELRELRNLFLSQQFQRRVISEAANDRIDFKFIPARSPNFGGLWESAVKSFKMLFKRTIGTHTLVYDNMLTTIQQIEAILNSRPLTPLSNDPNDFEALTPGHFLIQRPLTAIPEPDLDGIPENRLSAWQQVQAFTQQLWKKWSGQYLSELNNRTKWTRQRDNIVVGTMVVLKDDNLPPLKWLLARVTKIHAGADGNVRVVSVKTKDGSFTRAISKICVLPIRDNNLSADGEN